MDFAYVCNVLFIIIIAIIISYIRCTVLKMMAMDDVDDEFYLYIFRKFISYMNCMCAMRSACSAHTGIMKYLHNNKWISVENERETLM